MDAAGRQAEEASRGLEPAVPAQLPRRGNAGLLPWEKMGAAVGGVGGGASFPASW